MTEGKAARILKSVGVSISIILVCILIILVGATFIVAIGASENSLVLWFLVIIIFVALVTGIYNSVFADQADKKHDKSTKLVFTTIINNSQIKILSMQIQKQQFVDSILALVDHDTQQPVAGATFANVVLTSSDPSIFTADTDLNNDGILDVVGISEGTATLNVTADASYTDPNTQEAKTVSKSADIEVTVTAPPPGAINTDMIVSFSEAQPV